MGIVGLLCESESVWGGSFVIVVVWWVWVVVILLVFRGMMIWFVLMRGISRGWLVVVFIGGFLM